MSRIEELPDDFNESLNLNSSTTPTPSSPSQNPTQGITTAMLNSISPFPPAPNSASTTLSSSTPSVPMPPAMANTKQYSTDELLAELNRTPLFMTSLDSSDNVDLEALKALAYEGTKAEVAGNFREQGNECARLKQWRDAREYYDKAIAVCKHGVPKAEAVEEEGGVEMDLKNGDGAVEEEVVDQEAERKREKAIEEASYVNRALCNLELQNYGSCTRDCAAALLLNPHNIKALYRTSLALYALQKLSLAHEAVSLLLSIDPSNTSAQTHQARISASITASKNARQAREAREAAARAEKATLAKAIRDRGWSVKMSSSAPVDAQDAEIRLEDARDAGSEISVPVLLLYPVAAQSELVKGIRESETIAEHLEYILPDAPWDVDREYQKVGDVQCYMETKEGGLIKVGRKVTVGKVLGSGKVEVQDGLCRVFVVPNGKVDAWIEEFKRRRGK